MLEQLLKFFVVFFVVVEPVSLIPIFSALTEGASGPTSTRWRSRRCRSPASSW